MFVLGVKALFFFDFRARHLLPVAPNPSFVHRRGKQFRSFMRLPNQPK